MADGSAAVTPRRCTLRIDDIPSGPNARLHHMMRHRRQKVLQQAVAWQAMALVSERGWHAGVPFARAHIVATLHHRRRCYVHDPDNAVAACKCLIDGLRGVLIAGDSPDHITLEVAQVVGDWRGVEMQITEVCDDVG